MKVMMMNQLKLGREGITRQGTKGGMIAASQSRGHPSKHQKATDEEKKIRKIRKNWYS